MGCKLASLASLTMLLLAGTASAQQSNGNSPYPSWNPPPVPVPVTVPLVTSQPRPLPPSLDLPPVPRSTPAMIVPSPIIQRTAMLQPTMPDNSDLSLKALVPQEPPGPERLHMLHSEDQLFMRWKQDGKPEGQRLVFPDEPILTREKYAGRAWPERSLLVEPNYVNYGRLLFEEKNSERYGWDLGGLGTLVSTGYFLKDVAFLPYHRFTDVCRCFDSNAGYCLPGDPVPYKLYPDGLSATGALGEAGVIVTLLAIFP